MVRIKVYYGDCKRVLNRFKKRKFQLVLFSPPYNCGKEYEKNMTEKQYHRFLYLRFKAIYKVMDTDSRICVNIPFHLTDHSNNVFNPYVIVCNVLEECGFKFYNTVVWDKMNSGETTAWGSWKSASAPWIQHQTEAIVIYYKGKWKRQKGKDNMSKMEFIEGMKDIWKISPSKKTKNHPATYPLKLAERCIKLFSFVGDNVLDPFVGSGTTLLACRRTKRNGVGIELHKKLYKKEIDQKALIGVTDIMSYGD